MAYFYDELSRTFSEYLLLPNLTTKDCIPENVSLKTPIVRFKRWETSPILLNFPLVYAIMQAISRERMAIELARSGGLSFIYVSQPIDSQAEMVKRVRSYKPSYVVSNSNLTPEHTLSDVL